jgi:vacuolar protein sorting-associated protein 11
LLVLQILARDGRTSLGSVKEYVIRRLEEEQKLVEKDKAAIDDLEKETEKMRGDIETLRTKASVFQLTKCSYCGHKLELPSIHFMCMHSFHAGCIGENEQGCPTCATQNRVIMDIKQKQQENAVDHDQFFKLLAQSTDGFSTVAMYFGRGIFRALPQDDGVIDDRTDREKLFG